MKINLIIFSILCHAVFGYSQNSHFADIYITPRRVNYGWADGGVLQFKLNKKSIKVPYKDRSYTMLTIQRRVYELYHTRVRILDSFYQNLMPINEELSRKRILILVPKKDTIFIDIHYHIGIKNKCYEMSDEFKAFIEKLMPITIRENWQKHLPGR